MIYSVCFDKAFDEVIKKEGEYVNDPDDAGGETKFGISKRSYPNLDIKNLTLDKAKDIYHRDFWLRCQCEMISNYNYFVAEKLFDLSVNIGCKQAGVLLQRSLRAVTGRTLIEDGIIGIKTIGAIEVSMPDQLFIAMKSEAAGYYRCLAIKKPSQEKFLIGWLNRAYA